MHSSVLLLATEAWAVLAGTGISLAGVFIYSQVKRMSGKKKVAAA